MTLVALQAPWPVATPRAEKPTPSAHDLQSEHTVAAVPDQSTSTVNAGLGGARSPAREAFIQQTSKGYQAPDKEPDAGPQPFPEVRFADPLPALPELDLPGKKRAYQSALVVVRTDDPR